MSVPPYEAKALSPILPVADLGVSTRFYGEVLGFSPLLESNDYVILRKGPASLHLTKAAPGVMETVKGHMSIYLEVESILELWTHVSQYKDKYRIRDFFERDYGMWEFHICDPDGCLIFVGQAIPPADVS